MMADIPGLRSIWDEVGPDGETRIVFEVDDDKTDEFFSSLGLLPNDAEGFRRVILECITTMLEKKNSQETRDER